MCPDDNQSLWCYGYPNGSDPEFDHYPANYDTYVTFGPMDLSQVSAARVVWSMWNRSEQVHDSVFWGAATSFTLSNANMKIGGSRYEDTDDWQRFSMDLNYLHDFTTGDSVSMIGLSTVFVFWRFRSDPNATRNIGTFIDNVVISTDDSAQNVAVSGLEILEPDSDGVFGNPPIGDSLMAHFHWSVCEGIIEDYADFRVVATLNSVTVFDTVLSGTHAGQQGDFLTPLWEVTAPGDYVVRVVVDSMDAIPEPNEVDNVDTLTYHVDPLNAPPEFHWITPGTDTLFADSTVTLRWFADDPLEVATISLGYDNEPQGCVGLTVPGGNSRPEIGGEDSLAWDTHFLPNSHTYYLYAEVTDAANDTCIYAAWPLYVCHGCTPARERPNGVLPDVYYVEQNYPNPFNPVTEIRFGIAVPGQVTLKVFDLLGRDAATLVNEHYEPGNYVVPFDGSGLPSGLYLYVLTSPEGRLGRKMMLLK
jgi:hypothetical protein